MITFTIIESPYGTHPDGTRADPATVERNLRYVRAAMADCFRRGEIPLASHALYTQPGVLDDTKPEERAKGMGAGFALRAALASAEGPYLVKTCVYRDLGVTPGMIRGIEESRNDGVQVLDCFLGEGWDS